MMSNLPGNLRYLYNFGDFDELFSIFIAKNAIFTLRNKTHIKDVSLL